MRNTRGVAGDVLQQAHHLGLSGHDGAHLLPQRHAESFCALLEPALLLQLLSEAVEAAGETMQPGTEVQHLGQAGGLAGGLGAAAPPPPAAPAATAPPHAPAQGVLRAVALRHDRLRRHLCRIRSRAVAGAAPLLRSRSRPALPCRIPTALTYKLCLSTNVAATRLSTAGEIH